MLHPDIILEGLYLWVYYLIINFPLFMGFGLHIGIELR